MSNTSKLEVSSSYGVDGESEGQRLAQLRGQLYDCLGVIDRSFQVAEGKVPASARCICEFWSREPCTCNNFTETVVEDAIIPCHSCSVPIMQVYEKSIGGDIYQYCSRACAEEDYTICSACADGAEVSKKDCAKEYHGCCQQYLGLNLQYYCSERCKGEDTTDFIRSFRKKN